MTEPMDDKTLDQVAEILGHGDYVNPRVVGQMLTEIHRLRRENKDLTYTNLDQRATLRQLLERTNGTLSKVVSRWNVWYKFDGKVRRDEVAAETLIDWLQKDSGRIFVIRRKKP